MTSEKQITRRGFIQLAGASVSILALGGTLHFAEAGGRFLRPPGSLAEEGFLSRCIKCQKCLQVCPTRVVIPLSLRDSIRAVSTPTLNFTHGHCTLCMKCVDVCPSGAIQPVKRESVKLGKAVIIRDACIAWDWGGCTRCSAKCPENAIQLDCKNRPLIDTDACNGCGLCEYICPSSSLRAYNTQKAAKGVVVVPLGAEPV